eukprot:EG_transcript_26680
MGQLGEYADIGFQEISCLRLSRDDLERWVHTAHGFEDLPRGCFVRVLLEGDAERRKYRIARIEDYEVTNQPYVFGNLTSTNRLLSLNFGPFTASYQMNTVSNSTMLQEEAEEWLKHMKPSIRAVEWPDLFSRKRAMIAAFRASVSATTDISMEAEEDFGRVNSAATVSRAVHDIDLEQTTALGDRDIKRRMVDRLDGQRRDSLVQLLRQREAEVGQKEAQIQQLKEQLGQALLPVDLDKLS